MKAIVILILINTVFTSIVEGKSEITEDDYIVLSGNVNCFDPINGRMALVSIYNITKGWGTTSGSNGEFEIKMGRYDTIVFFTTEHKDYHYFHREFNKFEDHNIEIFMEADAIWLETVNIIGISQLEEFKMDVLDFEVADDKFSIAKPDLNKYAKERLTGKPSPLLIGPLTYLQNKFSRQNEMYKKIQKMDN